MSLAWWITMLSIHIFTTASLIRMHFSLAFSLSVFLSLCVWFCGWLFFGFSFRCSHFVSSIIHTHTHHFELLVVIFATANILFCNWCFFLCCRWTTSSFLISILWHFSAVYLTVPLIKFFSLSFLKSVKLRQTQEHFLFLMNFRAILSLFLPFFFGTEYFFYDTYSCDKTFCFVAIMSF